jgi:hypothetical protein
MHDCCYAIGATLTIAKLQYLSPVHIKNQKVGFSQAYQLSNILK